MYISRKIDIKHFHDFKTLTIISDCTYHSTTEFPGNTVTEIPVTLSTKSTKHFHTINSKHQTPNGKEVMHMKAHNSVIYIYVLIATVVLIPAVIIILRFVTRLFKSRWCRQLPQRAHIELLSLELLEEDVVFSRETEM